MDAEAYEKEYWEHNLDLVDNLANEVSVAQHPDRAFSAVFEFMERVDGADLGVPGSLVHTLEQIGGYEQELIASIRRTPSYYPLWMVNRILNGLRTDSARRYERLIWHRLLREVADNPTASEYIREQAREYIGHQGRVDAMEGETI